MGDLSTVDEGDSVGVARVFNLMRRYADAYPGDVNENNFYASLCSAVGDLPEAIRIYKRIYSLNPQKTDLLVTLGQMYGRIGEQDSSINYFNLYEKAEGPSPMITVSKVMAYLDKADTVGAVRELDQPIERNPKDCMAVLVKGMMMPNVGREDSSLYYMKRQRRLTPGMAR